MSGKSKKVKFIFKSLEEFLQNASPKELNEHKIISVLTSEFTSTRGERFILLPEGSFRVALPLSGLSWAVSQGRRQPDDSIGLFLIQWYFE